MTPLRIVIPGPLRGKGRPRASAFGGRARLYTPAATVNAEAWVKQCAVNQVGQPCLDGPLDVEVDIVVEVPASWSKRKRAEALVGKVRPTGKPDIDNCTKLLMDALNKIVWRDDAQVVGLLVRKRYGTEASTMLTVRAAVDHHTGLAAA